MGLKAEGEWREQAQLFSPPLLASPAAGLRPRHATDSRPVPCRITAPQKRQATTLRIEEPPRQWFGSGGGKVRVPPHTHRCGASLGPSALSSFGVRHARSTSQYDSAPPRSVSAHLPPSARRTILRCVSRSAQNGILPNIRARTAFGLRAASSAARSACSRPPVVPSVAAVLLPGKACAQAPPLCARKGLQGSSAWPGGVPSQVPPLGLALSQAPRNHAHGASFAGAAPVLASFARLLGPEAPCFRFSARIRMLGT